MKGEQLVATLQSGEDTKVFYGYYAFKDAYNEAADSDIITLSKGNFLDVTIEKSITIRGAGAFVEDESTAFKNLSVKADNAVIEGIYVTDLLSLRGNNQKVQRCNIHTLNGYTTGIESYKETYTHGAYISDCAIKFDGHARGCVDAMYKNCSIGAISGKYSSSGCSGTYDHCILSVPVLNGKTITLGYFYNCILYSKSKKLGIPNQFYDTKVYALGEGKFSFEDGVQRKNCVTSIISQEVYDDKFGADKFPYFFSEEVTSPEGAYFVCGVVNHKEWPAIPRVVESNISKETDESGHLKVEVKVSCEK